jgi:two-component sensor histidine kinase
MVQAIVGQSLRNSPASREAIESINSRLVALGNAHTAMTRTRWGNASIMDVIDGAIAVHRSEAHRIRIDGTPFDLGSRAALGIALALHELCTNAVKYGALSTPAGTVSIDWTVTGGAADARFQMRWKEQGGPTVSVPTRKGFGSRLIAESIASDLRGDAKLVFAPQGVVWTLDAPLVAIKQ